jgi:hypothetical protein
MFIALHLFFGLEQIMQPQTAIKFVQIYMKLMGVYGNPLPAPQWCSVDIALHKYIF